MSLCSFVSSLVPCKLPLRTGRDRLLLFCRPSHPSWMEAQWRKQDAMPGPSSIDGPQSLDEWVRKEQHKRDHKPIDGQGFHECKREQQHTAKVICNLWLSGDSYRMHNRGATRKGESTLTADRTTAMTPSCDFWIFLFCAANQRIGVQLRWGSSVLKAAGGLSFPRGMKIQTSRRVRQCSDHLQCPDRRQSQWQQVQWQSQRQLPRALGSKRWTPLLFKQVLFNDWTHSHRKQYFSGQGPGLDSLHTRHLETWTSPQRHSEIWTYLGNEEQSSCFQLVAPFYGVWSTCFLSNLLHTPPPPALCAMLMLHGWKKKGDQRTTG